MLCPMTATRAPGQRNSQHAVPGPVFGRAPCQERVAVHLERAGLVLALGAAERVECLADYHVRETAVLQHLPPAHTGQPAGYSTGPRVDVAQRFGWDGA